MNDFSILDCDDVVMLLDLEQQSRRWNGEVQIMDNQARKSHTSIISGKRLQEETGVTTALQRDYIIVKDIKEAQFISDSILNEDS